MLFFAAPNKESAVYVQGYFMMYGDGSIPAELAFHAKAVSPKPPTLCYPISAVALALRLLSSEPHRVRR
jgi:hypothetical protein